MNLRPLCLPVSLLALSACASSKPVDNSGAPTPAASAQTSGSQASSGPIRWTGSLQPTQQRTGGLGPTGQNKAFGQVALTSIGAERAKISISISTPLPNSASLNWAMLPGRCGTGSLPIAPMEKFPMIEVGNNGRGSLETEMSLALPESGQYHVNVYWTAGQQLSDVMTCANLRR